MISSAKEAREILEKAHGLPALESFKFNQENEEDLLFAGTYLAALKGPEVKAFVDALEAIDIYFKVLCEQWAANDGRVVSESGIIIEAAADGQRLCDIAGEKTRFALSQYREAIGEKI